MKAVSSVLVIKPGPVGDFLLSLPARGRIRKAHPDAHTTPRGHVAIVRARSLKGLDVQQVAETAEALVRAA